MSGLRASQTALEVARANGIGIHASQVALEVLRSTGVGARASQVALEVIRANAGSFASQVALEVARTNRAGMHGSQVAAEVVRKISRGARASQVVLEVARSNFGGARASQIALEVARQKSPGAHASQVALEIVRQLLGGAHASQVALEIARGHVFGLHTSQVALEIARGDTHPAYVTQLVGEALRTGDATARVTQVTGEVLRRGNADARITQVVAEVLRTSAPEGTTPAPMPEIYPWPFEPSWDEPIAERYGFKTDLRGPARDGSEQRALLRETPSGSIGFMSVLSEREVEHASVLLYGVQDRRFAVPLWQHRTPLLADAPPGSLSVAADLTTRPFRANGRVILWCDAFSWELAIAESAGSGTLTLTEPLGGNWPAGTALIPVVIGMLPEDASLDWLALSCGRAPVEFTVPAFYD